MKNTEYRKFSVPRNEGKRPFTFAVRTSPDGAIQVTRLSPYDETEYHWASKSAGRNHWRIIRNGHTVSTVGPFIGGKPDAAAEPLTPEQIAYFLIEEDIKAHLVPNINHN